MELTQLFQFKTIAECKTMTEAAQRLHISQPALSLTLKKLEKELGVQLFERQKNKILLNPAGKLAFTYACAVLGQAEEMKNAFRQYAKENSVLKLGFCDAGPMRLSVPLLQKANPGITICADTLADESNALNDLLSKKYDAVISLQKLEHPDVVSMPLAKEELMLSVPPDDALAKQTSVSLHHHTDREIAVLRIFGAYEKKIKGFIDWLESLATVTVYTDYFVFRQMLEHKKVLTFTTRLVQLYRNDGNRVILPLKDKGISAVYWLSFSKRNENRLRPITAWQQDNKLMLLGSENISL